MRIRTATKQLTDKVQKLKNNTVKSTVAPPPYWKDLSILLAARRCRRSVFFDETRSTVTSFLKMLEATDEADEKALSATMSRINASPVSSGGRKLFVLE